MDNLVIFIFLAIIAEILGTIGGFGSSLFFIPIASYFLDFHSVLGITALFHIFSNLTKIYFFRKGFNKKLVISLGLPAVIFVVIGAILSKYISSLHLELFFSIFIIITAVFLLFFQNFSIKQTISNSIAGGILSGFIAGLIGTGGAIRGITLAAFNLSKDIYIATSSIIDLGIDSSRSIVYYLNGYIRKEELYLIPILILVSVIGTWIGKQILSKISENQFKKTLLLLILVTGLSSIVKIIFS